MSSFENAWPYNPSSRRLNCHGDKNDLDCSKNYTDPDDYQDSCVNHNYRCSETTHQAQLVCHDGDCFYFIPLSPLDNAYKVAAWVELVDIEIEDPQSATLAQAFINMGGKTTRVERDVSIAGQDAILTVSSPISNETFYRGITYLFDAQATIRGECHSPAIRSPG